MAKRNAVIERLYDMASTKDENGLSKFDEQKLKRELDKNQNFMKSNKNIYAETEKKFDTCVRYEPCPICEKCRVKASHLYVSCQVCTIPICIHTHKNIKRMIIRKNFIIKLRNKEFIDKIKQL